MAELLLNDGKLYPLFRERLQRLPLRAHGIGCGYGDTVSDVVFQLEAELGDEEPESETPTGPGI
jgi:hypothetical protein